MEELEKKLQMLEVQLSQRILQIELSVESVCSLINREPLIKLEDGQDSPGNLEVKHLQDPKVLYSIWCKIHEI